MSEEPTRLRDAGSDALLRRDLSRARVREPSYDVGAGLSRFEAAIARGAPLPADPATASTGASSFVGWSVGTLLAVVVGALALTQPWAGTPPKIAATSGEPQEDASLPAAPHDDAPFVRAAVASAPRDEATVAPAIAPDVQAAPLVPRSPRSRARKSVAAASEAPPLAVDAEAEMKATRAAASALATDPARALALVEAADRDFPKGLFREDRRGIAALAELQTGRTAGRAHADAYLRAHPKGTYAERLRRALGDSPTP